MVIIPVLHVVWLLKFKCFPGISTILQHFALIQELFFELQSRRRMEELNQALALIERASLEIQVPQGVWLMQHDLLR
jgi:hypothetical protein